MPTFGNAQLKLLEKLCNAIAISGDESEIRKIVLEASKALRGRSKSGRDGKCIGNKHGQGRREKLRA